MVAFHCETLVRPGSVHRDVRIESDASGRISNIRTGIAAVAGDLRLGTVFPGFATAHSHAFHRLLRGTTHADGGDFWHWRDSMYRVAGLLDPALMFLVARAVFAEMLVCGYTAVGEFHYLHHRSDGSPHVPAHAMELAIAAAAPLAETPSAQTAIAKGYAEITASNPQKAIDLVEPVITRIERDLVGEKRHVYCGMSTTETLLYPRPSTS